MAAPPVRIRIGASLDASLDRALQSAAQKVNQAEKSIQRQKRQTTTAADREAKAQLKAQEKLAKAAEQLDRQRARGLYRQFREQERAGERAAKAQQRAVERQHAAERREIEKTRRAGERALEAERRKREQVARVAARNRTRRGESFARRTSHRATRFLLPEAPLGSMAMRGLGGVARGAGIDFSVQGAVGRVTELERLAQDLSSAAFQPNATGPNAQRVDRRELVDQARQVGGQLGIDSLEVLGALEQYQRIAGDLHSGREQLMQMAALAKATGTSLDDVAAASANVANGLGDVPNKAEIVDKVMRTIAGQGKLGAVEISDMATQMARVAASASAFAGDRADNIAKMGALAQIARAEGGAPSAAQASRSIVGFANTMKKSARIEAFKKQGIGVFTDDSQTSLKDPIQLIKESLVATGGDLQEMNKMFMDVIGARAVGGLQKTFVGAGGGEAGLAAIDKMIDRMLEAQVSREEVEESAARASETTAAKAERFQNALDQITEDAMVDFAPALEEAAPAILKFAQVIGDVSTWAVTNPKKAIGLAMTAAIARAGIETAFRAGIERMILGPVGPTGAPIRAGGVAGAVGKIGAGMTIAALGVTTLTVGAAYIDHLFTEAQREQREAVKADIEASNASSETRRMLASGDIEGAEKKAAEAVKLKETALSKTEAQKAGTGEQALTSIHGAVTTAMAVTSFGLSDKILEALGASRADLEAANTARDATIERSTQQQIQELAAARGLLAEIRDAIQNAPTPPGAPPGERVEQ